MPEEKTTRRQLKNYKNISMKWFKEELNKILRNTLLVGATVVCASGWWCSRCSLWWPLCNWTQRKETTVFICSYWWLQWVKPGAIACFPDTAASPKVLCVPPLSVPHFSFLLELRELCPGYFPTELDRTLWAFNHSPSQNKSIAGCVFSANKSSLCSLDPALDNMIPKS